MSGLQRTIDRDAAAEWASRALADPNAVILDTETTDLHGYICDLAVIRATDGEVLVNLLVNPGVPITPGAQAVHGIADVDVRGGVGFADLAPVLATLLANRRVLVYNAAYDFGRVQAETSRLTCDVGGPLDLASIQLARPVPAWECIMLQHAAWVGEWNEYHGNYRWHKLAGGDHRALGDCRAARRRLQEMAGVAVAP